jgi:hypothetical protein
MTITDVKNSLKQFSEIVLAGALAGDEAPKPAPEITLDKSAQPVVNNSGEETEGYQFCDQKNDWKGYVVFNG